MNDEERAAAAELERMMAAEARRAYVARKLAAGSLIYRRTDNAPQDAPDPVPAASDNDWQVAVGTALGEVAVEVKRQMRAEQEAALVVRDRKIAELEGELREVRGMLAATLQLLGPKKLWKPGDGA